MLIKIINKVDCFVDWTMTMLLIFSVTVLLILFGSGLIKYAVRQEHEIRIVKAALIETSDTERKDYGACK